MEDDTAAGDPLDHLSDQEWVEAIFQRARERSSAEEIGADTDAGSPRPANSGLTGSELVVKSGDTGFATPPEEPAVSSRRGLVTREEIDQSFESPFYPGPVPVEHALTAPGPAVQDLGIPKIRRRASREALEWGAVIVGALVMAFLIKAFLFQAYYIPSPSMEPTLGEGDRIIVNKVSYRLHDVNRGDLVVFEAPEGTGGVADLIKRVIALPGELLRVVNGRVLIDDGMLLEPYLSSQHNMDRFVTPPNCVNLLEDVDGCRVPPGHVFVLGDHRDNSRDSRFFGPIPKDSIRGRAFLRIWPIGEVRRL